MMFRFMRSHITRIIFNTMGMSHLERKENIRTIGVILTRLLHCTQYTTWKNVDHVHRMQSGTPELHEV
jgi:hypothetical protein